MIGPGPICFFFYYSNTTTILNINKNFLLYNYQKKKIYFLFLNCGFNHFLRFLFKITSSLFLDQARHGGAIIINQKKKKFFSYFENTSVIFGNQKFSFSLTRLGTIRWRIRNFLFDFFLYSLYSILSHLVRSDNSRIASIIRCYVNAVEEHRV